MLDRLGGRERCLCDFCAGEPPASGRALDGCGRLNGLARGPALRRAEAVAGDPPSEVDNGDLEKRAWEGAGGMVRGGRCG